MVMIMTMITTTTIDPALASGSDHHYITDHSHGGAAPALALARGYTNKRLSDRKGESICQDVTD